MVISRTPFRLSFLGGGTDYPGWYREHGGTILATTINKYCTLTCRYLPPFFEHRYRVVWSKIENCQTIDEITHPSVRETLRYLGIERGLEIHHDGDLPARSGTGSSSSFTVGLLKALYALNGKMISKNKLVEDALHIEQNILKENVGSQDQVMAAHGGFNRVDFHQSGQISVVPMSLSRDRMAELESHLVLFYTGITRTASDVAKTYITAIDTKRRQLRIIQDLAEEGFDILNGHHDIAKFGELMHENWQVKRELGKQISNPMVDDIYEAAQGAGAIGGKLSGAGGGGFMLLFVPPSRQEKVAAALNTLVRVPFAFEKEGSKIIFFDPQEDYEALERQRQGQTLTPFRELSSLPSAKETQLPPVREAHG